MHFALPDGVKSSDSETSDDNTISITPDVLVRAVVDVVEQGVVGADNVHGNTRVIEFGGKVVVTTKAALQCWDEWRKWPQEASNRCCR